MKSGDKIKLFRISHEIVESELDAIEDRYGIDLGREHKTIEDKDDIFYPQFDKLIRDEAESMAVHYELFYCLEKSIRQIVSETLHSKHGPNWWEKGDIVPKAVKDNVTKNMRNELDSAVTPRSAQEIDYTTFGELGEIVNSNWDDFSDLFNSKRGFNKVMTSLNMMRGPIAHCCPLPENEVVRLRLTLEDWFRLME